MKILLADDDPSIIELLTEYLAMAGHAVSSAYDAKSLVSMIAADVPELVFCDINMPGIRDDDRTPKIEIPMALKNIPVVALTGNEYEKLLQMGLPKDIQVLAKPIDFAEVDAVIAKYAKPR